MEIPESFTPINHLIGFQSQRSEAASRRNGRSMGEYRRDFGVLIGGKILPVSGQHGLMQGRSTKVDNHRSVIASEEKRFTTL